MSQDREAIRNAVADLRAKLDALEGDLATEPFASDYDGILRTQTYIGRWSRKHLAPKMIDLLVAIEDAGCDTTPEHSVVSELAEAIDTVLVDSYEELHEHVRECVVEGRTAHGRREIDADRRREDRDERRTLEAAE